MDIREELKSAGVYPTGPVSAWPEERNEALMEATGKNQEVKHEKKVKAGIGKMAKGLLRTAQQAAAYKPVSREIRDERYETCKNCPLFVEESKRCSDCGCFMEAKTWMGAPKHLLCPQDKWAR